MARVWTAQEDSLIRASVERSGVANRDANSQLRKQLKVSRHQLRSRMNVLGLTKYGRSKLQKKPQNGLDQRQLDLERENQFQTTELKQLTRKLAVLRGNESIIRALREELHEALAHPLSPLPQVPIKPGGSDVIEEDLVMHLSDEHADQTVMAHRVLGLENYTFATALARAERYVKRTLDFTQHTMQNYRFPTLWLLCYGDHTSGEIHGAVSHSEYRNIFRNTLAIGQLHALMIRDLAPFFNKVNVVCVPGNHGRRSPKKNYHGAWDNWDYLVHETAAGYCRDLQNVDFAIPDAFSVNVDIRGYTFNVSHGDDIKSWNSIPYYGIERKTRRLSTLHSTAGQRIRYFVMGHFHQLSTMQHPDGETIVNGSFKFTDEFAYNALAAAGEPMQLIHGVHADHGVTWRLPVHLRFAEEKKGPERYKINLAAPS
jgi:hypothetical protein